MPSDSDDQWDPTHAFAAASGLLDQAAEAREALFDCWSSLTGMRSSFDCEVIADSDSTGHLDVTVVWPPEVTERAELAAEQFARLVKEALDAAFAAVAHRRDAPEALTTDVLPLCITRAEFEDVREAGVLRRLRPDQVQLVEAVQPYHGLASGSDDANDVGRAMRQLAATLAPRDPAKRRVALWATDIRPDYLTRDPNSWVNSKPLKHGLLVERLTIDHFTCGGVSPGELKPDPKVGYLLVLNDDPLPIDVDDGLSQRTHQMILIARTFVRTMSRSTDLDELRRAAGGPVQDWSCQGSVDTGL